MLLAGCTGAPPPAPSPTPAAAASSPSPSPDPAPTLVPDGDAKANLPYFDRVNRATIAAHPSPTSRDFVEGLVAAGFDAAAIEATADTTSVGLTPGSLQFSVLIGGSCLLGQYGAKADGYRSTTASVLSTGRCLIGQPRG